MTPDEAIEIVRRKVDGRTRYAGQLPFADEVLVAEIERLRCIIAGLEAIIDGTTRPARDFLGELNDKEK